MFWQFFVASVGVLVLAIVCLGFFALNRAEVSEQKKLESDLLVKARVVQNALAKLPGSASIETLQSHLLGLEETWSVKITLLDKDRTIIVDSSSFRNGEQLNTKEIRTAQMTQEKGFHTRYSHDAGETMMYVALYNNPATSQAVPVDVIQVGMRVGKIQSHMATLRLEVWLIVGITGSFGLLLAFLFTRRIIRPLSELAVSVEGIAAGDYGRRVYAAGRNEIGILARTFNETSERLAALFTQLDDDRQQLRAVLSSMVEGVIAVDGDQHILFANERAGQLLEFETRTVVGRRLWEVVRHRSIQDVVKSALSDYKGHKQELEWKGSDVKSLTVHAGPLPGTPPRGAVLVLHDTTELRRLERIRQEFVANVSHELKTPLSVIMATSETLLAGALEDEENRDRFVSRISEQSERLEALVSDLLSLARVESGGETYVFEAVNLRTVILDRIGRRQSLADAKRQQIVLEPPDEDIFVWADEEAVIKIFDNLFDNAIKYTPEDTSIWIRWWEEDEWAFLEVKDSGIGIPPEKLPRIFERFFRIDKARSRELGGTGLGLSIVKHLVQAMQGSVQVESKMNEGATFRVRLPRPQRDTLQS
ncbi:MAG: ATP-binding protein [Gemmataceae bacterium]